MNNNLFDSQTIGEKYIEIVLENFNKIIINENNENVDIALKKSIAIADETLIESEDKYIEKFNRKSLQNYLLSKGIVDNQKFANHITKMAIKGQQLKTLRFSAKRVDSLTVQFTKRRKAYEEVEEYVKSDKRDTKICAIYGIRRTGKSTLMEQVAQNLSKEQKLKAWFITCNNDTDFYDVVAFITKMLENGDKYFFIDEITSAKNFQNIGQVLSDVFVKMDNAKIVVTGTDSLGLSLVHRGMMYDRIKFVPTTYTSFSEYSNLTGIDDIDDYVKFGSTLKTDCFYSYKETHHYIETSIVSNIIGSLEKSEGLKKYPPTLTELYNNNDLNNAIQRIITRFAQNLAVKLLTVQIKNHPVSLALTNLAQKSEGDKSKVLMSQKINFDKINDSVNYNLGILTTRTFPVEEKHINVLSDFLEDIGLITTIPVIDSFSNRTFQNDMKIISHPGMFHAILKYTLDELQKNENWLPDASNEDRTKLLEATYTSAVGDILENVVIKDVFELLSNGEKVNKDDIFGENTGRWYVSKLSIYDKKSRKDYEADLIIFDKEKKETYLFEVKHSKEIDETQSKHLGNERFNQYVEENFGQVKQRVVLYNGKIDTTLNIPRVSITKFLKELNKQFNIKDFDMNKFIDSLLSDSLCPNPKPSKKIDNDIGYGY